MDERWSQWGPDSNWQRRGRPGKDGELAMNCPWEFTFGESLVPGGYDWTVGSLGGKSTFGS